MPSRLTTTDPLRSTDTGAARGLEVSPNAAGISTWGIAPMCRYGTRQICSLGVLGVPSPHHAECARTGRRCALTVRRPSCSLHADLGAMCRRGRERPRRWVADTHGIPERGQGGVEKTRASSGCARVPAALVWPITVDRDGWAIALGLQLPRGEAEACPGAARSLTRTRAITVSSAAMSSRWSGRFRARASGDVTAVVFRIPEPSTAGSVRGQVRTLDRPGAGVRRVRAQRVVERPPAPRSEVAALQRLAGVPAASEVPAVADPELWRLVRRLPEQQRWAVALHYVEDRPVAEVAAVLGCWRARSKTHLSRARATLARQLDETREGATS